MENIINMTNEVLYIGYEITAESWVAWTTGLQIIERARAGLLGEEVTPYTEEEYIQHLDNCLDKVLEPEDDSYAIVKAETIVEQGIESRLVFVSKNPNATRAGLLELLQLAASRQLRLGETARAFLLCENENGDYWVEQTMGLNENSLNRIVSS